MDTNGWEMQGSQQHVRTRICNDKFLDSTKNIHALTSRENFVA